MKSQVGASEKSYNTLKSFLPPEVQSKFDSEIESLNQDPNASLRDKAAFWDQAKSFIGSATGQAFQMQKQQQDQMAAMGQSSNTGCLIAGGWIAESGDGSGGRSWESSRRNSVG
jgi:hypothetical protein